MQFLSLFTLLLCLTIIISTSGAHESGGALSFGRRLFTFGKHFKECGYCPYRHDCVFNEAHVCDDGYVPHGCSTGSSMHAQMSICEHGNILTKYT